MSWEWLLSPWLMLLAILSGGFSGYLYPDFASLIGPFGALFFSLFKMCIIPILFTGIISGLGNLFLFGEAPQTIKRGFLILFGALLTLTLFSSLIVFAFKPGQNTHIKTQEKLSQMIFQEDLFATEDDEKKYENSFYNMMYSIIPHNLILSVAREQMPSVVLFSLVVGLALGSLGVHYIRTTVIVMEALYLSFCKIISILCYLLSPGLFCITALQVSAIQFDLLHFFYPSLLLFFSIALLIASGFLTLLIYTSPAPWRSTLSALKFPLIIAFASGNGFIAMLTSIKTVEEYMGIRKRTLELWMPLGVTFFHAGEMLYFAILITFIAYIHLQTLSFDNLIILTAGNFFISSGAIGMPLSAMGILIQNILVPMKLPLSAANPLLTATGPVVGPFAAALNHLGAITFVVFLEYVISKQIANKGTHSPCKN